MTGRNGLRGKGQVCSPEELLKTIIWERERRDRRGPADPRPRRLREDDERHGRSWFQHLWPTPPKFGGRPHPGKAATESLL